MTQESNVLRASKGKVLKRKGTEEIFGREIYLGYSYYIGGVKLEEPHLDVADDFEEVDIPAEWVDDSLFTEWTDSQKVKWEEEHPEGEEIIN